MHTPITLYNFDVCIVMPLCKPKPNWHLQLTSNIRTLKRNFPPYVSLQFILVNDGFETPELLNMFDELTEQSSDHISVISYPENMGKGYALREGVKAAEAACIIMTDFDFPYQFSDIVKMYNCLINGSDIVVGKRDQSYYNKLPAKRYIVSKACSLLNKFFLRIPFSDAQSGIKALNQNGKKIFLATTINRFLVDTEFLYLAHNHCKQIKVVDVELREGIKFSNMGVKIIGAEFKNFIHILLMNKKRKLFNDEEISKHLLPARLNNEKEYV